jgi:hypothetical protein
MSFPETGYVIKGITPEDAYNWMMTHTSFGLPFGRLVQQLQDYNRQALTSTRPGSLPEYHTHYGVTA